MESNRNLNGIANLIESQRVIKWENCGVSLLFQVPGNIPVKINHSGNNGRFILCPFLKRQNKTAKGRGGLFGPGDNADFTLKGQNKTAQGSALGQ